MKTGIVFEGGAFRTIFSCGVMDAFLANDINADYIIGVSAGAAYATSYVSKQPRRNLDVLLGYKNDKRYMGVNNMFDIHNRSYYNIDFVYNTIPNELVPFDYDKFMEYKGEFIAVVTNVETGKPEYLKYTGENRDNTVLVATCALPMVFPNIYINDTPYLDGGLSDSIPFEKAFEDGCDRVIVVLTRERTYRKRTSDFTKNMARFFHGHPELAKDLVYRAGRYNRCLRRLKKAEEEGKVIVLAPDNTEGFSRMERNGEKILNLYNDGYKKGTDNAKKIKRFFSE